MLCTVCGKQLSDGIKFCSSCGAPIELRTSTKAVRKPMSSKAKVAYSVILLSLVSLFLFFFIEHLPGKPDPVIEKQPDVAMATMYTDIILEQQYIEMRDENGKVIIPLNLLLEKKIVSFDYQDESQTIPLLAFINTDGKLVTCIRLCEPCNSKTFSIKGGVLACGNCETEWKQNNLEGIQGSCQKYPPLPIPSVLVGSEIQISKDILRAWRMRI